ncbi:polysaccharide biosynthesis protein [Mucilaginibacter xinganensis]|nr:nucleoside-diphosphate sugar epimerase/dehydratase [Mucilaginibacter xinganensis]
MRIHTRIIRHSNTRDMMRVFAAVLISNILFTLILTMPFSPYFKFSLSGVAHVLMINIFISSSLLMGMRIVIKDLFVYICVPGYTLKKDNVLVYGSNNSAILIKNAVEAQNELKINVLGFIDSKADKIHKHLEQKRVYPIQDIACLKQKYAVKTMFFTAEGLNSDCKRAALDECIKLGIKVITVPPSKQWINGRPNLNEFKDLKIEDLLERAPIELCKDHVFDELDGKKILVTGAAGSIGSEIVRQILSYNPEYIILCDQAESPLHDIQLEIEDGIYAGKTRIFIADIKNTTRIKTLFNLYKPQIVFHAAAYKHVPMMENNPTEAVLTNIWGTKNIADISLEFGVEKFVMISTDKAVRPTNIMGATKRIAEMYIQSLNNAMLNRQHRFDGQSEGCLCQTKFITTRFGNVLGSNGSVIPRFKSQIERGGPVTVTHPDITRYFMTIPEAVQLVLEAAVMGKGAEIFLFDMGDPVKITDLAANMIKLAGLKPGKDIEIIFTGLRPGEKLYEELLNDEELVIPTYNKSIKISKTISNCYIDVDNLIKDLLELNASNNIDLMVSKMKSILPDFISNNSKYEKLDLKMEKLEIL